MNREERIERMEGKRDLLDTLMIDIETAEGSTQDPDQDKTIQGIAPVKKLLSEAMALVQEKYDELDESIEQLYA